MATLPESEITQTKTGEKLRLRLGPASASAGTGAWWPRSRDLQVEARMLVDQFPSAAGRINRLLMSRPDWDDAVIDGHGVRRIHAGRGQVKIGSFPRDDTQLMILSMANGSRLHLRVIPFDTDPAEADRLLEAVGT